MAYLVYQRKLRRAKSIERGLKMVPIQIHLPPSSADTAAGGRDVREIMREKTAQAEVLYNLLAGTASAGFKSQFYGQRHIALEIVASHGLVHFYAAVPVALVSVVQKSIQTAYPGARLEQVEDHNIFNQEGRLASTMGGEIVLKADSAYPLATYRELDRDPLEAIITSLSSMGKDDGAAIQIMVRPAAPGWVKNSTKLVDRLRKGEAKGLGFSAMDMVRAVASPPTTARADADKHAPVKPLSNLQLNTIEQIETKTKQPGFEVLVRLLVSTQTVATSQQLLRDLATAFSLFEAPGLNGFKFLPAIDVQGLVTAFILRFFPPDMRSNILNSTELATLFHLPDSQFVPTANVERQASKEVDGPVSLPTSGLLFGFNEFRGVKKEIRLSNDDRRRHTYVLGQTGTGKSTLLENLAVQDMLAGNGFAFIDPHGDVAEKLLTMVPKERAEDVIYFNPSDTEYPLGLNLFEFSDPSQKDFLIQETIGMLYKLYDPNGTGVIGPRFEQWYRNAALTLMSDPAGATFLEIPKVFTDTEYLKQKFRYLKDPTVIDFWTKEMGQTSDYHKSEMLGYFVSKFGAFQQNEIMRNIIGQTKSAFDLRDIMDNKKILIVNLSKGQIGELNSKLLGMMFVIKFQAAAMSRANIPEADRTDFSLYVDEFQNFSTDSFASILSEARKYRLNLIVANQFIGQLTNEIRDAVFGNIGTILGMRMGPEDAEFMVKQFAPIFDARDLVNLPNGHAAMRMMLGGVPSQPFTIRGLPPLGTSNVELGMAIKELSAAKFGAHKAQVDADIAARLTGRPAALPAPVAGSLAAAAPVAVPDAVAPVASAPAVLVAEPAQPIPALAPAVADLPMPQFVPEALPPLANLAQTPPPIGAPPIGSSSPFVAQSVVADSSVQSMQPVQPIIPEPEFEQAPMPAVVSQPASVSEAGGLSITDITGGRQLPVATVEPVAAIPPIGAPPMDVPMDVSPIASIIPPMPLATAQPATPEYKSVMAPVISEAAAILNDIPLIPVGAEPVMPVTRASQSDILLAEPIRRERVIELADTPMSDDPMAGIALVGDFTPIHLSELVPAETRDAVSAGPQNAIKNTAAVSPDFDPASMVALTPAEREQQPKPSGQLLYGSSEQTAKAELIAAKPVVAPIAPIVTAAPIAPTAPIVPIAPAAPLQIISQPALNNIAAWNEADEPEPREIAMSVAAPELREYDVPVAAAVSLTPVTAEIQTAPAFAPNASDLSNVAEANLDVSGSLVHFVDPKLETILDQAAAPVEPTPAAPSNPPEGNEALKISDVPAAQIPEVEEIAKITETPADILAAQTIEPATDSNAFEAPEKNQPSAQMASTPPPIGAPPLPELQPVVATVEPVISSKTVVPAISDSQPQLEPVLETNVSPTSTVTEKSPAQEVKPVGSPVLLAVVDEIPRITEVSATPVEEIVTSDERILATPVHNESAPEPILAKVPARSSEQIMAEVMEAARLRQAGSSNDSKPEAEPEPIPVQSPVVIEPESEPVSAPNIETDATPEIHFDMPQQDPVLAAEDEIDDLLNSSLIHNSHRSSLKLPEPDSEANLESAEESTAGVITSESAAHHRLPDVNLSASESESDTPGIDTAQQGYALNGGHKVIQPLQEIVSHKADFAQELSKLAAEEATVELENKDSQFVQAVGSIPISELPVPEIAVPTAPAVVAAEEAPDQPPPALAPFDVTESVNAEAVEPEAPAAAEPVTDITASEAPATQSQTAAPELTPVSQYSAEEDFSLPEAESLVASDVAAARIKREADSLAAQAAEQAAAQVAVAADSETSKPVETEPVEHRERQEVASQTASVLESLPKRKRTRHRNKPKSAVVSEVAPETASTNVIDQPSASANNQAETPTEKVNSSSANIGTLIMPNVDASLEHSASSSQAIAQKPAKLAKGEVYVDEKGNVIVGE